MCLNHSDADETGCKRVMYLDASQIRRGLLTRTTLLFQGRQRLRYYPKLPCSPSQALDLNSEMKRKESGRWGPTGGGRSLAKVMATGSNTTSEGFLKYISSTSCDQFHLGIVAFHMEALKLKGKATGVIKALYIRCLFFSEAGFTAVCDQVQPTLTPGYITWQVDGRLTI